MGNCVSRRVRIPERTAVPLPQGSNQAADKRPGCNDVVVQKDEKLCASEGGCVVPRGRHTAVRLLDQPCRGRIASGDCTAVGLGTAVIDHNDRPGAAVVPSKRSDARARQLRMIELRNDDRRIRLLRADGERIGLVGFDVDSTLFTRIEEPIRNSFQLRLQSLMWSAVVVSVGHSNRFKLLGFDNEFTVKHGVVI